MTQQVQELIDKIKSEGVQTANQEAERIIKDANQKADKIIADAKADVERMKNETMNETQKLKESTEMSLQQSSRDMILSLRKKIESVMNKIVEDEIKDALKADALVKIIEDVIEHALKEEEDVASIEVVLNNKDKDAVKKSFSAKLQKKLKEPVTFKGSDDVSSGFTISFDEGKSSFDFSDEALAGYLSSFLNTHVAELVKNAVK